MRAEARLEKKLTSAAAAPISRVTSSMTPPVRHK